MPRRPEVNGDRRHRRTQAERSATTRAALLRAGRALFGKRGFAATSREAIVEAAGVTRGALYHHITGKEELFRAVFEAIEEEMTERLAKVALSQADPLDAIRVGCREFLDIAMDPAVQRIVLIDAPAVLGWQAWREVESRYGLGLVTIGLQNAMDAGALTPQPIEPLAHMLLASLNEAALLVAGSDHPKKTRREVGAVVEHLIDRLAAPVK